MNQKFEELIGLRHAYPAHWRETQREREREREDLIRKHSPPCLLNFVLKILCHPLSILEKSQREGTVTQLEILSGFQQRRHCDIRLSRLFLKEAFLILPGRYH